MHLPGTTAEEDSKALSLRFQGPKSPEERCAMAYRLEKKKVLRACLSNLGVDMPPLPAAPQPADSGGDAAAAGSSSGAAKSKGGFGVASKTPAGKGK